VEGHPNPNFGNYKTVISSAKTGHWQMWFTFYSPIKGSVVLLGQNSLFKTLDICALWRVSFWVIFSAHLPGHMTPCGGDTTAAEFWFGLTSMLFNTEKILHEFSYSSFKRYTKIDLSTHNFQIFRLIYHISCCRIIVCYTSIIPPSTTNCQHYFISYIAHQLDSIHDYRNTRNPAVMCRSSDSNYLTG
jgi:hypothetical protein